MLSPLSPLPSPLLLLVFWFVLLLSGCGRRGLDIHVLILIVTKSRSTATHVFDVSKVRFCNFNFRVLHTSSKVKPTYMYQSDKSIYLTQRFRHIFIDFPPLTPDALEPKTTLSRDPPEGRWKSVLMVEAPLYEFKIAEVYSNRKVCSGDPTMIGMSPK